MSRHTRQVLEIIYFLAIILGVPLFIYQQVNNHEMQRIEQTLNFINLYQEERISKARVNLFLSWDTYASDIRFINLTGGIDEDTLRHWVDIMIEKSIEQDVQKNLNHAILDIIDFFDQLYFCVNANGCSGKLAQSYFQQYAEEFDCLYGHRIIRIRESLANKNFGSGVRYFAKQIRSCSRFNIRNYRKP